MTGPAGYDAHAFGTSTYAPYVAAALGVMLAMTVAGYAGLRHVDRAGRLAARIRLIRAGHEIAQRTAPAAQDRLLEAIGGLGRMLASSGMLPAKTLAELQLSLNSAGLRGNSAIGLFVGSKALLLAALAGAGWLAARQFAFTGMMALALPLGGAVFGMLLPDLYLRRMRARHLKAVQAGLPDALDMLVICTEAGLGLEAGIDRVAAEIGPAHPAIAEELQITGAELRMNADRRQVLLEMGGRTGLDSLRRLAATLIQTIQFGTPLSQALRVLATEMRQEALTRFEARAARLPVLLTVPMIVFILPCIFIIVGGPAAIQLTAVLGKK